MIIIYLRFRATDKHSWSEVHCSIRALHTYYCTILVLEHAINVVHFHYLQQEMATHHKLIFLHGARAAGLLKLFNLGGPPLVPKVFFLFVCLLFVLFF